MREASWPIATDRLPTERLHSPFGDYCGKTTYAIRLLQVMWEREIEQAKLALVQRSAKRSAVNDHHSQAKRTVHALSECVGAMELRIEAEREKRDEILKQRSKLVGAQLASRRARDARERSRWEICMAAQGQLGEAEELRLKKQVIRCAFAHVANEAAIDREVRARLPVCPSACPVSERWAPVGHRVCRSKTSLLTAASVDDSTEC